MTGWRCYLDMARCDYCDEPGGLKTYENQACVPINGRVQGIDWCIHRIVTALNAGGVRTVASCCRHGEIKGNIILEDGRVLIILPKEPDSVEAWQKAVEIDGPPSWKKEPSQLR